MGLTSQTLIECPIEGYSSSVSKDLFQDSVGLVLIGWNKMLHIFNYLGGGNVQKQVDLFMMFTSPSCTQSQTKTKLKQTSYWLKWNQAKIKSIPGDQSPGERFSQQLAFNTWEEVSTQVYLFSKIYISSWILKWNMGLTLTLTKKKITLLWCFQFKQGFQEALGKENEVSGSFI